MSGRSAGSNRFGLRWTPHGRYLLDHSLSRGIAEALRSAGWDIHTVTELFGVGDRDSVLDEAIIPRCAQEGRAWITADDSARRQHYLALTTHLVSVLWVRRPKEGMGTPYQMAVLANAIGHFDALLTSAPTYALYCEVNWPLRDTVRELERHRRPFPGTSRLT